MLMLVFSCVQLFATARKPADQAYELFQQRVAGAQKALGGVQDRLSNLTEAIPRSQEEGQKMLMLVFYFYLVCLQARAEAIYLNLGESSSSSHIVKLRSLAQRLIAPT